MRRTVRIATFFLLLSTEALCALTVVLVRHAEITTTGADPPLSSLGKTRAGLLASMLRDSGPDVIYVSEFRRTEQTAQPTADRFHLRPERVTGASGIALADVIRRRRSGTVLVVGHSNTIPEIISALGGPTVRIGETEFDNFFILTVTGEQISFVRLHYGSSGPIPQLSDVRDRGMLNGRSRIMQITFAKSGGFSGALRNVKGTIDLKTNDGQVSGDAAYHRELASDEAADLRAGADPAELSQAAGRIAASAARGAADLDHYHISVKTADGKTHDIDVNTSGASNELQGVSPAVAKLIHWVQEESQKILTHRMTSQ